MSKDLTEKTTVTIPLSVKKACISYAKIQHRSLSNFIACVLAEAISSMVRIEPDGRDGEED
jgi:hypothetical protein